MFIRNKGVTGNIHVSIECIAVQNMAAIKIANKYKNKFPAVVNVQPKNN